MQISEFAYTKNLQFQRFLVFRNGGYFVNTEMDRSIANIERTLREETRLCPELAHLEPDAYQRIAHILSLRASTTDNPAAFGNFAGEWTSGEFFRHDLLIAGGELWDTSESELLLAMTAEHFYGAAKAYPQLSYEVRTFITNAAWRFGLQRVNLAPRFENGIKSQLLAMRAPR
jgi:hypothetical protein